MSHFVSENFQKSNMSLMEIILMDEPRFNFIFARSPHFEISESEM